MTAPATRDGFRVVVFSSGPVMTNDARRFVCRLDDQPEIELAGVFCQAESTSAAGVLRDLLRRRGVLAAPLFALWAGSAALRWAHNPRGEARMRRHLRRLSNRIHVVPDIHAEAVIRQLEAARADLGLVYGSPILREELFGLPRLGTLGIHHGKVPAYRGNKTTFWAMYNGERTAGVTIQKIEAGLDTGRIVREGEVVIGNRSRGAVWRDLEGLGLDLYVQAILDVKNGTAEYRPQEGPKGKLYRNPRPGDLLRFHLRRLRRRLGPGS